jgi:hypothetical protein
VLGTSSVQYMYAGTSVIYLTELNNVGVRWRGGWIVLLHGMGAGSCELKDRGATPLFCV